MVGHANNGKPNNGHPSEEKNVTYLKLEKIQLHYQRAAPRYLLSSTGLRLGAMYLHCFKSSKMTIILEFAIILIPH